jgi:hypothetical protein
MIYQECPRPNDVMAEDPLSSDLAQDYAAAIESGDAQANFGHLRVSVSPSEVTVDYVKSDTGDVGYTYTIEAPSLSHSP